MKTEIKTDTLVIGNSAAAIGAAQYFAKENAAEKMTVVSKEPYSSYSRPFIVYYAAGEIEKDRLFYKKEEYLTGLGITEIRDCVITELDVKNRVAISADNRRFHYSKLLLGSGSSALKPPIPGADKDNVVNFMTLSDAETIKKKAADIKSAVVIGGGLVGLKAVEALHLMGKKVTVIDIADFLMARVLDKFSAELMQKKMGGAGIDIFTGTAVKAIYGEDKAAGVLLDNGKKIDADLVVVSVGVKPNLDFLPGYKSGFLSVNRQMKTEFDGIYGAGDIVSAYNPLSDTNEPNPVWPNAYKQGLIAAANILGNDRTFAGSFQQNVLEFADYPIISYGKVQKDDADTKELVNFDRKSNVYRKAVIKNGKLIGAVLAGNIERAGVYKGIMENGLDVSAFSDKLTDFDFGYQNLPETYMREMFYKVSS